jgi:hypothetical protein
VTGRLRGPQGTKAVAEDMPGGPLLRVVAEPAGLDLPRHDTGLADSSDCHPREAANAGCGDLATDAGVGGWWL